MPFQNFRYEGGMPPAEDNTHGKYTVCNQPEDMKCSNSLTFRSDHYNAYIFEHRHYFNRRVIYNFHF